MFFIVVFNLNFFCALKNNYILTCNYELFECGRIFLVFNICCGLWQSTYERQLLMVVLEGDTF